MREIVVDNFAGGGGASTGIEIAIGRSVDTPRMNKWPGAETLYARRFLRHSSGRICRSYARSRRLCNAEKEIRKQR